MDEKEKINTKEVPNLNELSRSALQNLEPELDDNEIKVEELSEFDEAQEDANLVFKTEVKAKEEIKEEKKGSIFKKLGRIWKNMPKKNRILIIVGVLIFIIAIVAIIFLLSPKKEEEKPKLPDIILSGDNYRYENGKLIFLDDEDEIGTYECENKDQNLCKVAALDSDEFDDVVKVDEDGNKITFYSPIYENRYVFIIDHKEEDNKEIKLYDMKEESVVSTVFGIKNYQEGYVACKDDESNWGLKKIEENEIKEIIPSEYDELGILPNQEKISKIVVRKNNNSYIADVENKILSKAIVNKIVAASDKYILAKSEDSKYHVYNYNAKEVHDTPREYIRLLENYILVVDNESLYVYDYENHPMTIETIKLKSTAYNPIETYKNKKLVKLEKSFEGFIINNVLNLTLFDELEEETKSINLLEGEFSKTLAYLNYFNGVLYFYKDEEKKEQIGRYECTNKNTIESNTKELNNCRVASESFLRETRGNQKEKDLSSKLGWIPIFSEKYVFIKDGDTIVLYDLKQGSDIANYHSVDTSSYTQTNEITFVSSIEIPFVAESKSSSKYGVAKITSEGVSSVIDFKYDSMKMLGNYYVAEKDGKYILIKQNGEEVGNFHEKTSPIVDYHKNYVKTLKDNMYYVHSFTESISNNAYNYIELYDDYYAAVLNGYVSIFDYNNKQITKDKDENLKLNIDNYYQEGTKAFVITFTSDAAKVKIGQSNNTYGKELIIPLTEEEETHEEGESNGES